MDLSRQKKLYWIGIIGLFLLLLVAVFATTFHILPDKLDANTLFISRLFFWVITLLVFLYASKIESGKLLLWEEQRYSFGKSFLQLFLTILAMYGVGIMGAIITKLAHTNQDSSKMAELIPILRKSPLLLIFTCLTAGVTEELLMRGYMMPRLNILFKSPVAAIIISSVLFGLLHASWGTWVQIVAPFLIGLVLAYAYWKYRSIKINMIAHFIFDLVQLLLFMNLHK